MGKPKKPKSKTAVHVSEDRHDVDKNNGGHDGGWTTVDSNSKKRQRHSTGVVFNVEIGVCAPGSSACQQPNCSAPVGTTRKRRDVTDVELNEVEMSKSLVIFPTKQSETEFLTKVADQLDLDGSTDELDQNQVCVDRTTSFSVIAILSGLVVFSCLVVTFMLIRSRQFRGKGVGGDERGFSNKSYHS